MSQECEYYNSFEIEVHELIYRSYFCRPFIEGYFLNNPSHAKFINKDLLETYYPVGGVRIEDDILVTPGGYENLTSAAPKGDEMLDVINGSFEKI